MPRAKRWASALGSISAIMRWPIEPHGSSRRMITILLSTYNGARFLFEQLASFERQTDPDWRLIWRDDGSTDDTVAIMQEFNARTKRCTWIKEPITRLGPTDSFLLLLREACRNIEKNDIIVFSDQDDVWLPEKLERAKAHLGTGRDDTPALYFARQKLVDKNNIVIGESAKIRFLPSFPDCLVQNVAAGCTIALNYKAATLVNSIRPPKETFHDWWCYIVVSACGGRCIYDDEMVILYRQHSNNAVGAQRNIISRATGAIRRGPGRFMAIFRAHIDALQDNISLLAAENKECVEVVFVKKNNNIKLFHEFLNRKIKRQNIFETILLYVWVLLKRV